MTSRYFKGRGGRLNMTSRELEQRLLAWGFVQAGSRGGHTYYEHPSFPGKVTITSPGRSPSKHVESAGGEHAARLLGITLDTLLNTTPPRERTKGKTDKPPAARLVQPVVEDWFRQHPSESYNTWQLAEHIGRPRERLHEAALHLAKAGVLQVVGVYRYPGSRGKGSPVYQLAAPQPGPALGSRGNAVATWSVPGVSSSTVFSGISDAPGDQEPGAVSEDPSGQIEALRTRPTASSVGHEVAGRVVVQWMDGHESSWRASGWRIDRLAGVPVLLLASEPPVQVQLSSLRSWQYEEVAVEQPDKWTGDRLTVGELRWLLLGQDDRTMVVVDDEDGWWRHVNDIRLPAEGGFVCVSLGLGRSFDTREV